MFKAGDIVKIKKFPQSKPLVVASVHKPGTGPLKHVGGGDYVLYTQGNWDYVDALELVISLPSQYEIGKWYPNCGNVKFPSRTKYVAKYNTGGYSTHMTPSSEPSLAQNIVAFCVKSYSKKTRKEKRTIERWCGILINTGSLCCSLSSREDAEEWMIRRSYKVPYTIVKLTGEYEIEIDE